MYEIHYGTVHVKSDFQGPFWGGIQMIFLFWYIDLNILLKLLYFLTIIFKKIKMIFGQENWLWMSYFTV